MEDICTNMDNNNPYKVQSKGDCRTRKIARSWREIPYCLVILITGKIQTWSTIVDKNCRTKEQIEAKLRSFKDRVKLMKHSVGFMFACSARGSHMHDEKNVESNIFKTLFPKVPLVGCFGDGEFGKKTTPVDEMEKEGIFLYF